MALDPFSGGVVDADGPVDGATITLWLAPLGSAPVYNTAPPSGSPDAGPVTTGESFGGPGMFQITPPAAEAYWLSAVANGGRSWRYYDATVPAAIPTMSLTYNGAGPVTCPVITGDGYNPADTNIITAWVPNSLLGGVGSLSIPITAQIAAAVGGVSNIVGYTTALVDTDSASGTTAAAYDDAGNAVPFLVYGLQLLYEATPGNTLPSGGGAVAGMLVAGTDGVLWTCVTSYDPIGPVDAVWVAAGMSAATYDPAGIDQQVVGTTAAQTVTNKRITRRVVTTSAPGATPAIDTDTTDVAEFTGLATAITSMSSGLTGTPVAGDMLEVRLTGAASTAITWGASFEPSTVTLPTTTSGTAKLSVVFEWNTVTSAWRCVGVA